MSAISDIYFSTVLNNIYNTNTNGINIELSSINTDTEGIYFNIAAKQNTLVLHSTNRVGIGINTPNTVLDVSGVIETTNGGIILNGGSSAYFSRPSITPGIQKYEINSVNNNDTGNQTDAGFLLLSAGGGVTATSKSYIQISGFNISPFDDMIHNIAFGTAGNEKMRITNNGNVGIGTSTPAYKLMVQENNANNTNTVAIKLENKSNSLSAISLNNATTETSIVIPGSNKLIEWHCFDTNSAVSPNIPFCIKDYNKIGINNTNPTAALHVNGNVNISGNIDINPSNYTNNAFKIELTGANCLIYKKLYQGGIIGNTVIQNSGGNGLELMTNTDRGMTIYNDGNIDTSHNLKVKGNLEVIGTLTSANTIFNWGTDAFTTSIGKDISANYRGKINIFNGTSNCNFVLPTLVNGYYYKILNNTTIYTLSIQSSDNPVTIILTLYPSQVAEIIAVGGTWYVLSP